MYLSVSKFILTSFFSGRPIRIGALDHGLSTARFLHLLIMCRPKVPSIVLSLRFLHITLSGALAMHTETRCWNGPQTLNSRQIAFDSPR